MLFLLAKPIKMKRLLLAVIVLLNATLYSQKKQYKQHTIAFYNAENLFDTINDPIKFDEEFTPESDKRWNTRKYTDKVDKISKVISLIGLDEQQQTPPVIIGLCEIENRSVLEDVIKNPQLKNIEYDIIHFDSPDLRGIDVALLYQKKHFYPTQISKHPLMLYKADGKRLYTRDQLLVTGLLDDEEIHVLVNHWPSRFGGEKKSAPNRLAAAQLNRTLIDSLLQRNPKAKIITMGDFNDGPTNASIADVLQATANKQETPLHELYNPMYNLAIKEGLGTLAYNDVWELFDQIILSKAFLTKNYTGFQYRFAKIANLPFLHQQSGKYKGYPLRSTSQSAGYSDHFPVYITLVKEVK